MRLAATLLTAALLAFGTAAHAAPLDVRDLSATAGAAAHFPVAAGGNAKSTERINQALFIGHLAQMAPRAGDAAPPLDGMSYRVLRNDSHVLSLQLDNDQCGNTCGHSSATPAFDIATGRHLLADDLFTAQGREAIARKALDARTAANRTELAALRRQPATDMDAQDKIGLYEACKPGPALVGRMRVEAQAVVFVQPRCANRAQRQLDDLGDHESRMPMAELRPWMSDYGRLLLLGEGSAPEPASPFGQVLRGSIDAKLPITLSLGEPRADGKVDGVYFYDRYRAPITLAGRVRDGTVELEERASHARLRLKTEGAALRGDWRSGQKTLPVAVAP